MKTSYIIFFMVLMLGIIGWFLIWPAVQDISQLSQSVNDWQSQLADAKAAKQGLAKLQGEFNRLKSKADQIDNALPSEKDLPDLLVQAEALASQSGLVLGSISFTSQQQPSLPPGTEAPEEAAPAKILQVTLSLDGNYTGLKNFLTALENNLRVSDVSSISFLGESSGTDTGKLNISFNVYFKS